MAETTKPLNLYQRLLNITDAVGKIEKTGTNTSQNYKFIEQAMIVAKIGEQMAAHGVMILPETVERHIDRYTAMKPGYNKTDPPKEQVTFHAIVRSRYTLVNVDAPDDRITLEWDAGEALDTSDKATNKATTASDKTFLMKLFKISDKDDPDAHHNEVEQKSKPEVHYEDPVYNPDEVFDKQEAPLLRNDVKMSPEHVTELLELAKKLKGAKTKGEAATAINKAAGTNNFLELSDRMFTDVKAKLLFSKSDTLEEPF